MRKKKENKVSLSTSNKVSRVTVISQMFTEESFLEKDLGFSCSVGKIQI